MTIAPEPTIVPSRSPETHKHKRATDLAARTILLGLMGRMEHGAVFVSDGGRRHLCGRPLAGEVIPEITVADRAAWRMVLAEGSVGLGRSYFEGRWNVDSLDELTMFLRVLVRNLDGVDRVGAIGNRLRAPLHRALQRKAERPGEFVIDRQNIRAHYDLGNEVFKTFLDDSMMYSAAIFSSPEATLHDAQVKKLDRLCRKLALSPADHVVEIGTGWGGFAIYAASTYGCRVTTTTISNKQFHLAQERVRAAGLSDLVSVRNDDYRSLEGVYDKLVSIEMIEAVDWRQYGTYFAHCARLIKPDGLMALQAIIMSERHYERAKRSEDFIKHYIFPGSCIPSIGAIIEATRQSGDLQLIGLEDIGNHYAETLRRWRENLVANADQLRALHFDEAFRKMFEFYFCYCEAAFAERRISDVQCVFARKSWRSEQQLRAKPPASLRVLSAD